VSRQAISKHLSLLDAVGLVDRSAQGREVLYTARLAPLGEVASWLESMGSAWDQRLERLRKSFDG
jgi:DNA-binding transcriptional ArsR family regulator